MSEDNKPPEVLYWSPNTAGTKNTHGLYTSIQGIRQARRFTEASWRRREEVKRVWRAKAIVWEEITLD
jgi:hypothetical protein